MDGRFRGLGSGSRAKLALTMEFILPSYQAVQSDSFTGPKSPTIQLKLLQIFDSLLVLPGLRHRSRFPNSRANRTQKSRSAERSQRSRVIFRSKPKTCPGDRKS